MSTLGTRCGVCGEPSSGKVYRFICRCRCAELRIPKNWKVNFAGFTASAERVRVSRQYLHSLLPSSLFHFHQLHREEGLTLWLTHTDSLDWGRDHNLETYSAPGKRTSQKNLLQFWTNPSAGTNVRK